MVGIVTVVRVVSYSGSAGWSLVSIFWMVRWSGKLGWLGAVYLVDWLDGQCGQVGQVVGMLESSSQDDISNSG